MGHISPTKRKHCYKRDNNKCVKCGTSKGLTVDHVIPKTMKGGTCKLLNLQTMCKQCNNEKGRTVKCYTTHKKTLAHLRAYGYA